MYHVMFLCSGCTALFSVNQLMCLYCVSIDFSCTYLKTRLAFFPFIEAFLHINQCFSSGIFSELGSLLPNEAPGILFSHRHKELLTLLVSFTLFSITQYLNNTLHPVPYLSMFQLFVMKSCHCFIVILYSLFSCFSVTSKYISPVSYVGLYL